MWPDRRRRAGSGPHRAAGSRRHLAHVDRSARSCARVEADIVRRAVGALCADRSIRADGGLNDARRAEGNVIRHGEFAFSLDRQRDAELTG